MATTIYQGADDPIAEAVDDEDLHSREEHWQIHRGNDEHTDVPRERVFAVKVTDPHVRSA